MDSVGRHSTSAGHFAVGRLMVSYAKAILRGMALDINSDADLSQCHDWVDWGEAFGITARGGSYIVKYIFYCIFSVGPGNFCIIPPRANEKCEDSFCCHCMYSCYYICSLRSP